MFSDMLFDEATEDDHAQASRNSLMRSRLKARKVETVQSAPAEEFLCFEDSTPMPQLEPAVSTPSDSSSLPPWMSQDSTKSKSPVLRLHEEMISLAKFVGLNPEERQQRLDLIKHLETAIYDEFDKNVEITIFGSFVTGLSLYNSDIDISVTKVLGGKSGSIRRLGALQERFAKDRILSHSEVISKTRVPILKLRTTQGIWVDIVVNHANADAGTKFMLRHLKTYPIMRPLIIFLKVFLQQRRVQETYTGGMGSFLLFCMVLSFIQNWGSNGRARRSVSEMSLGHLLMEFLDLYGVNFDYNRVGVSVLKRGHYFTKDCVNSLLTMESPVEVDLDVGKNCFQIMSIKRYFSSALVTIGYALGKNFPSILSSVIPSQHSLIAKRPAEKVELPSEAPTTASPSKSSSGSISDDSVPKEDLLKTFLDDIDRPEEPTPKKKKKKKRERALTLAERIQRSMPIDEEPPTKKRKFEVSSNNLFSADVDAWSS